MASCRRGDPEEPDAGLRAPERCPVVSEDDRKTSVELSYFTPVLSEDAIQLLWDGKSVR